MKKITAIDLRNSVRFNEELSEEVQLIENDPWNSDSNVLASFSIGYDHENIYLRYNVSESNIIGIHTEINKPVYEDSCVEFFVSFDNDFYYNLEFNCIGTVLGEYGKDRSTRNKIDIEQLEKIRILPSLGHNKIRILDRPTEWALDIIIPVSIFNLSNTSILKGRSVKANFYKCGDKLPTPHYLSWNPVLTEIPDFHAPHFFGELKFQ